MTLEILAIIILIILAAYYLFMWPQAEIFGAYPYQIKTDKKVIALTFDDGPNPPYTKELLAVLDKHQVAATFFVLGKNLERFPDLGRAIVAAGHTLGNHAYSHNFLQYFCQPSLRKEILRTQEIIISATGKRAALFRSPWLIHHPSLFKVVKKNGLTAVSGLFSSQKEIWQPPAQILFNDALKKVAPGKILIFHDGYDAIAKRLNGSSRSETVKAIDLLIPELKKQGYQLVTVDHLLGSLAYQTN